MSKLCYKAGVQMTNKDSYREFCNNVYVPIYSKPWWMDAVCGPDHWDVWLYEKGGKIWAAMPYFIEQRKSFRYITKPLLTQNNGIIFSYPENPAFKRSSRQAFEEDVIEHACRFIRNLGIDVYEQQYHYTFSYWLPFFWNHYTAVTRVTYVIEDTSNIDRVWDDITSKCRSVIRKGQKNAIFKSDLDKKIFYMEHEKIFARQGLKCPFSYEFWERLYLACRKNHAGKIIYAETSHGEIASLLFLVWDEQSIYHLLGGNIPGFQNLDTYSALTWEAIKFASERNLRYDFEGSVIKRISKSFREFGGEPKRYYRIRKIFNEQILRQEFEDQLSYFQEEFSERPYEHH